MTHNKDIEIKAFLYGMFLLLSHCFSKSKILISFDLFS